MSLHLELLEQVLDLIADTLINSEYATPEIVKTNQKTVRNGIIKTARNSAEKLILYQRDIKANREDLVRSSEGTGGETLDQIVENIATSGGTIDKITITVTVEGEIQFQGPTPYNTSFFITDLLAFEEDDGTVNPVNLSQFLNIDLKKSVIDPEQANEFLDTNIYELLSGVATRQERINKFFDEFQNLIGNYPYSQWPDDDGDGLPDMATDYDTSNDITQNPDSTNAYITRLDDTVAEYEDTQNEAQTLQSLRNILNNYLTDIDAQEGPPQDVRPEYVNQSDGYLKFRNLNQGIIIRNTDTQFVNGFDINNLKTNVPPGNLGDSFLKTGFTITMWVRFLDKVSEGTLFNFANPTRSSNPLGFKLDTITYNQERRFVRLLVYDNMGLGVDNTPVYSGGSPQYYDSHVGMEGSADGLDFTKKIIMDDPEVLDIVHPFQYTEIPMDFTEWYFICATYNQNINEKSSQSGVLNADYWRNNMVDNSSPSPEDYTHNSGYGNRSKVEIISRNDLLRARGYKYKSATGMGQDTAPSTT